MNKFGLIVISTLASLALLVGYNFSVSHAAQSAEQNAATVNGKPIPMSLYTSQLDRLLKQFSLTGRKLDEKQTSALKKRILDSLIAREVLKQEAQKRGIKADDAMINSQMQTFKKSATPEKFEASLKQMNMTEATFRDYLATEFAIKKMIDTDLASKVTVTPREVRAFYDSKPELFKAPEMVRASHILVKVDKNATAKQKAAALAKIKAIRKRILKGADFATVAREVSDDTGSKANGGDLNFFAKGQMVPEFEKAAFSLKPGQMSGIVTTQFGYHLIKVTALKPAGTVPFDKIKDRIEQHLKTQKMQNALPPYIEALKSKAKIEIFVKA
ncbi:MAG: peptidylprolyl isomerase [Syntrophobacteraceae bacterium]|nr:peptidylprolyl isomerase [Syntrophobacteraceae bacterium]